MRLRRRGGESDHPETKDERLAHEHDTPLIGRYTRSPEGYGEFGPFMRGPRPRN